jgi:PKD repeat protein
MKRRYYVVLVLGLLAGLLAFSACPQQASTPTPRPTPIVTAKPSATSTLSPTPVPTFVPPPHADFVGSPTLCNGPTMVYFTDLSTGEITSWLWDFGNGHTPSTDRNASDYYSHNGNYTVSLTVTGPGGTDVEIKTNYINVIGCPT